MKKTISIIFFLYLFVAITYAQISNISGSVVDESGEPIIGASITLKDNRKVGTLTNVEGKFRLSVSAKSKSIIISYIGMKAQEAEIKPVMKIKLFSDAQLHEVVVTGMQKMDKRLFTGATTKIDAASAKLDGVADISRALEGKAAGVSVQNVSGTFGTAPKIRVRGATSIYGSSKPLWVVDGVVMEDAVEMSADDLSSGDAETLIASAIAGLNADDIESFQILKDGSATSIYGARAMAGVIVVTTKKGQTGVSRISYTGEFTSRMIPSYNDYNISNSQEQMGIYKELEGKGWLEFTKLNSSKNSGVYGKMYSLIDSYNSTNGTYGLANTQAARNSYLRDAEFRNTNWFDELFLNSVMQNHSISFSTGTEKAKFYASLSVLDDPGWYKSSDVQRYTANMNASFNVLNNLSISVLTNGSYRNQKAPGTTNQETDVVSGTVSREFDINPFSYAMNTSRTLDANESYRRNFCGFNIKDELNLNNIDINITDVKFQGELNYKPVKGMEINGLASIRYQSTKQEHHIKDNSNQARAYRAGVDPEDATIRENNTYLYTDPEITSALPESVLPEGGIYNLTNYALLSADFRGTISYNTTFDEDKHILNLFAGAESNSTDRQKTWFRGWGYQYDNGGNPYYDYRVFKMGVEEKTNYYTNVYTYSRSLAFFGMATYSYLGRYTLNGTLRYEGTNKMGVSSSARWLPTWNISSAWNAHEEKWFRNTFEEVLTHATLKASYSLTADRGPADVTNSLAIYESDSPYRPLASVNETRIKLKALENSELTYEKKHELNVGSSLGFVNNRINFDFDYYTRNNFDLIGYIRTSGVGGEITKMANVASMSSNGVEFTISTKNIKTKKFSWNTDFIYAYANNKITDLQAQSRVIDLVKGTGFALEGYPVRSLFSIPFAGLNDEGLPMFYTNAEHTQKTLTDINFQEYTNLKYLVYEGPVDAPINGSFGNIFTYDNFKLNIFITYAFGNVLRLDPVFSADKYSDLSALPKEFKNRWVTSGDENTTNIPVIASKRQAATYSNLQYAYSAYNYSTVRVADGGFVRLKEVSLGYDFPKAWLGTQKAISSLGFKFSATNLFLLYADKKLNGQDPEYFSSGGVSSPIPRQFTMTVRLGL
ncbi:MAG: SusC/RagA family TonB-linked outer membrane protein [Paludibacter sp.]